MATSENPGGILRPASLKNFWVNHVSIACSILAFSATAFSYPAGVFSVGCGSGGGCHTQGSPGNPDAQIMRHPSEEDLPLTQGTMARFLLTIKGGPDDRMDCGFAVRADGATLQNLNEETQTTASGTAMTHTAPKAYEPDPDNPGNDICFFEFGVTPNMLSASLALDGVGNSVDGNRNGATGNSGDFWNPAERFTADLELNAPFLSVSLDLLDVEVSGPSPVEEVFTVRNTWTGTMDYTIAPDQVWLSVDPPAGTSTGNAVEHVVHIDPALVPLQDAVGGNYQGRLIITAMEASNSPRSVNVNVRDIARLGVQVREINEVRHEDEDWEGRVPGFGRRVALAGDRLAVAPGAGSVYIFSKRNDSWVQETRLTGPASVSAFGESIAMSGDTLIVHGLATDGDIDSEWFFFRRQHTVDGVSYVRESSEDVRCGGEACGVAVSGNFALLWHTIDCVKDCGVQVLRRTAEGAWVEDAFFRQKEDLHAAFDLPPNAFIRYINAADIDGDRVVLQITWDRSACPSIVELRECNSFHELRSTLVLRREPSPDPAHLPSLWFKEVSFDDLLPLIVLSHSSRAVDMSGNLVIVGNPGHGANQLPIEITGAAYVFRRVPESIDWEWVATLLPPASLTGRWEFGHQVAMSGSRIAVSARSKWLRELGTVFLFERSFDCEQESDGWCFKMMFPDPLNQAANRGPDEPLAFGDVLAVDGNKVAVGNELGGIVYIVEPFTPHELTVDILEASPNPVPSEGEASLVAVASDTHGHDATYSWSMSCPGLPSDGSFDNPMIKNPRWTAPRNCEADAVVEECTSTVNAMDSFGLTAADSVTVAVNVEDPDSDRDGDGLSRSREIAIGTDPCVFTPHSIELAVFNGANSVQANIEYPYNALAVDSHFHRLEYEWTIACPELGSNGDVRLQPSVPSWTAIQWTPPSNCAADAIPQQCTITLRASDNAGLSETFPRDVTLEVDGMATDLDEDGLQRGDELLIGTDPCNADSDGDGLRDGIDPDSFSDFINSLPETAFRSNGHKTAIVSILEEIEGLLAAGEIGDAVTKLRDLRRRVDGCSFGNTHDPDNNDWIRGCGFQLRFRGYIDVMVDGLENER